MKMGQSDWFPEQNKLSQLMALYFEVLSSSAITMDILKTPYWFVEGIGSLSFFVHGPYKPKYIQ